MAFDFPASPAIGEVSNGYTYDGMGWRGGPGIAGPVTEQFFAIPAGATNLDISVPAWAQGVQIIGSVFTSGGNAVVGRVSFDGTTFGAGASDYNNVAASHSSGSGGYQSNAVIAQNFMYLGINGDATNEACQFTAEFNLVKPVTTSLLTMKVYSKHYDSSAVNGFRTWWGLTNIMTALSGTNLAVKAIRILHGTGGVAFPAGSFIKVRWLGDSAAIPASNAIADCPSDGGEYVRCNGVWRLKEQSYNLSGLTQQDIPCPLGAKSVQLIGFIRNTSLSSALLRVSGDGSTFYSGASDYQAGGHAHSTGTAAYVSVALAGGSGMYLSSNGDNPNIPHQFTTEFQLTRENTTQLFAAKTYSRVYNNAAANLALAYHIQGWAAPATILSIKALRIMTSPSLTMGAGSTMTAKWMY